MATGRRNALVLASRGDPLTPHLQQALRRRYPVSGELSPELSTAQRLVVAAATFRPDRSRWAERFFKSGLAYDLRSSNAAAARRSFVATDPVLQVHALFEVPGATSLLYVDCTHRQAAELWPAWNPLRGNALRRWYDTETRHYQRAEHLFAFTDWTRRSLVDDYGVDPSAVSVVQIGSNDLESPDRLPRPATTAPTVLMVGNDFVRKGGNVLVAAFEHVRKKLPDARLVLAGTKPPLDTVPDGVEVLGRVHDRAAMTRLYEQADVFVMPSLFDPMPLAVLEAMGHGLPVVASAVCGIPDMVADGVTGHLVEPDDQHALADALVRALAAPGRDVALGLAGQRRVREAFSWDHVVDRMSPVLDRVLG